MDIIFCEGKLEVGRVYRNQPFINVNREKSIIPAAKVLREATRKEYEKHLREDLGCEPKPHRLNVYYYVVSWD